MHPSGQGAAHTTTTQVLADAPPNGSKGTHGAADANTAGKGVTAPPQGPPKSDSLKSEAHDKASAALGSRGKEVFEDPDTPVLGNPKGDVALVEFFDYRCPYCKQVEPSLEALLGEDRQLRLVLKEFPVLGPESVTAARAALAARKQGKYDALHRALMALKGQIDETTVLNSAAAVGLDVGQLKRDMAAPEIDAQLQKNSKLADALDIHGTPGFVVGDEIVPGAIGLNELKQLIEAARHK